MAALLMWVGKREFLWGLEACLPLAKAAKVGDVLLAKGRWGRAACWLGGKAGL